MRRATLLGSAAALDWLIGDPESWPHPVRWMGAACVRWERTLRRPDDSAARELASGSLLVFALVAGSFGAARSLLWLARRMDPRLGASIEILLAASCLAARSLDDEVAAVLRALTAGDLPGARRRLARIVGRDTDGLDEHGISRALIETLAESCSDGLVAPLFFLMLGGVPAAMAFKAISTLDSMIGYRTPAYLYFGRAAARVDDLANLLPARLTARLMLLVAGGSAKAAGVYRRDRGLHASPNAGHPEAAMAGCLGVRLGGPSSYGGEPHEAPVLGGEYRLPDAADARRALKLVRRVTVAAAVVATGLALLAGRRGAR